MKTIIAGSRSIINPKTVNFCINYSNQMLPITEGVNGTAKGVDTLGAQWCKDNNIDVIDFKPDYKSYGRFEAPKKRNIAMGDYSDNLIAIWDGKSTGTIHMLKYMNSLNKRWILFNILERKISLDARHPNKGISFL